MRKAILTKPLDGKPEGSPAEFSNIDFDMLEELGAVKAAPEPRAVEEKQEPAAPESKVERAPLNKSAAKLK